MDKQEYLNQIATNNQPTKKSLSGLLSSKFFIVGMIGVVALILIIVVGAILGGAKGGSDQKVLALQLHIENTSEVIQNNQSEIKSSILRSGTASLVSILSVTNRDLTSFIDNNYSGGLDSNLASELDSEKDDLESELFEAKINGIFDRIYAHKMAYEITLIMSEEAKIINSTNNNSLISILNTSYDSLDTLYSQFNDFSEVK